MPLDYISSRQYLYELLDSKDEVECKLLLNGGAFSRKTLSKNEDGTYHVYHHIDDTEEDFPTLDALCDETNIGEGISKNAFAQIV